MVDREEFERIVKQSIESLPLDIKEKIENVEFIVLNFPTFRQRKEHGGAFLLGLYEGIPLSKRGVHYSNILPDRIYIFMQPILYVSNMEKENLKDKVRKVVLHEIGHYFGLSEEELREKGMF